MVKEYYKIIPWKIVLVGIIIQLLSRYNIKIVKNLSYSLLFILFTLYFISRILNLTIEFNIHIFLLTPDLTDKDPSYSARCPPT